MYSNSTGNIHTLFGGQNTVSVLVVAMEPNSPAKPDGQMNYQKYENHIFEGVVLTLKLVIIH